jgi:hypothetical protein
MFREITSSMEERLELIKNSMSKEIALREIGACDSLDEFYHCAGRIRNGIISQMELYILENYKKLPLTLWNKNRFKIYPHIGTEELYFGKLNVFKTSWKVQRMIDTAKKVYDKSIKITSINFVLDEHDGDFSVDFNKGAWSFLTGDDTLTYYYTIKNYLDEKV